MIETKELYQKLLEGIRRFFENSGYDRAILGLSGGIDSAVVTCLAKNALGKDKVHVLLMPSPFSTLHSLTDALKFCEINEIAFHVIPIDSIYNKFTKELADIFTHTESDVTEENLQARIRTCLLMAYSNKFHALLLNTSNKSELAMGYGTLYGDLGGALMVLGDCYKCQVYELARHMNSGQMQIPENIILKAPSAELYSGQFDTDFLPAYPELDPLLIAMIEEKRSPEALISEGANPKHVHDIVERLKRNQFKFLQLPPLLQVSSSPLLPKNKCL